MGANRETIEKREGRRLSWGSAMERGLKKEKCFKKISNLGWVLFVFL